MSLKVPCYSVLLLVCSLMLCSVSGAKAAAEAGEADTATAIAPVVVATAVVAVTQEADTTTKAADATVKETPVKKAAASAVGQEAQQTVFPKIKPRRNKWGLDLIEQHGRKNGWRALPADSVRIIPYNGLSNTVSTGFQVDLSTGEVKVLSGAQDVPKIRSFKLQSPELEDLKKLLESKSYHNLTEEGRAPGLDGATLLVESDWQGEYRWRLYWVDEPYPLAEIAAIVQKAYARDQQQRG